MLVKEARPTGSLSVSSYVTSLAMILVFQPGHQDLHADHLFHQLSLGGEDGLLVDLSRCHQLSPILAYSAYGG